MKVQGRGKHGPYRYLGCSAAPIGGCDNRKFYRLDKIEHIVLPRIADEVIDDIPRDDPTVTLQRQITRAKADASQIVRAYERAMFLTGELADRTAAKLGRDHADKRAEIGKLEWRLAEIQSASPASELQRTVRTVLGAALTGDVTARAKIADALPGLLKTPIVCRKDGTLRVDFGSIGRNATLAWTLALPIA